MRLASAYALGLLAAVLGSVAAVAIPALAFGRLDIFYKRGQYIIWGVAQGGDAKVPWAVTTALARAIGAFGTARIVFALLRVPPTPTFALALLLILVFWDARRVRLTQRAPIPVPTEVHSLHRLRTSANAIAATFLAMLFLYL